MDSIARISQWDTELEVVSDEIERWRQHKRHVSEAMPTPLWQAAARLAAKGSVGDVARCLGLDYGKLKWLAREQAANSDSDDVVNSREADVSPEFVELGALFGGGRDTVVEMQRDGSSLRVELPEAQVDIVELATCFFWGMP